MKQSNYIIYINKNNDILCFNTLHMTYFSINKDKISILKSILEKPDVYKEKLPSFYNSLVSAKFIIEDEEEEFEKIKEKYIQGVNSKDYQLIILPTLECNFSCWYCVQTRNRGFMGTLIQKRILKHIENMIEKEAIESLTLNWFGGEPFKYYESTIRELSMEAKQICAKHNLPFISAATTNGFLLNENIIKELSTFDFRYFQITLDGSREYHNKTRVSKKESSFDKILQNVNLICSLIDDVKITIRINYDQNNLDLKKIIEEVCEIIPVNNRHKISFNFRRIWQVDKIENARNIILDIYPILRERGFAIDRTADIKTTFIPCYANRRYCNAISFNGNIFKCTAREDMYNDSWGKLNDQGEIDWGTENFEQKYYSQFSFDNEECKVCKYLPLCMGSCPKEFEKNNLNKVKHLGCGKVNDLKFEDSILLYCEETDRLSLTSN